jgi:hypothetical protein
MLGAVTLRFSECLIQTALEHLATLPRIGFNGDQFMNEKCGLVNSANPCRCARKTRGFMQAGYVDPNHLEFTNKRLAKVSEVGPDRLNELETLDRKHAELFRDHGFLAAPDLATKLRELISQSGFDAENKSAR